MNIKALRLKKGMTQEQFAEGVGVSFATVNRWENGHFKPLPVCLKQLKRIEHDFKTMEWLKREG